MLAAQIASLPLHFKDKKPEHSPFLWKLSCNVDFMTLLIQLDNAALQLYSFSPVDHEKNDLFPEI